MDYSSGFRSLRAIFGEIFVARQRLCQEIVLTGGIDPKLLRHRFQCVKRFGYSGFRVLESFRIDAMASAIQYSADKTSALAGQEKQAGGSMSSSKSEGTR